MADDELLFAVLAEKEGEGRALFLHGLPISKLYEHIVVPYEEDRPFFVDGVPVDRKSLRRIKIIRHLQFAAVPYEPLRSRPTGGDLRVVTLTVR